MVLPQLGNAIILFCTPRSRTCAAGRSGLAESFIVGLSRFLPVIGIAFVQGFLILLGVILLIVPGLILYTMWFVGLQACVVERLGP